VLDKRFHLLVLTQFPSGYVKRRNEYNRSNRARESGLNGLVILTGTLFVAALCSMRLRHGTQDRATHAEDRSVTGKAI
jgi:hypothetical protein